MSSVEIPQTLGGEPVHQMTALAYEALGPGLTRGDSGDWLLLKFVDAICHELKPVWDLVLDNPNRPGWWDAFNPYALPGDVLPWLPWLAQWTGDHYDTSVNGINPAAPSPDQVNRNLVARRRHWHRGTIPVLEEVILERIPSGATVTVAERVNGNIAHMSISITCGGTLSNQLLGVLYQAILASIPAGDSFDLTILVGPSFAAVEASLNPDTFAGLQSLYPTFNLIPTTVQSPYTGPLPPPAVGNVPYTTWYDLETFEGTWQHIESYGSWYKLETAGTT